jgi:hypothetical protein
MVYILDMGGTLTPERQSESDGRTCAIQTLC